MDDPCPSKPSRSQFIPGSRRAEAFLAKSFDVNCAASSGFAIAPPDAPGRNRCSFLKEPHEAICYGQMSNRVVSCVREKETRTAGAAEVAASRRDPCAAHPDR